MDVADINHDGNLDIILGNFSIGAHNLMNQKDFKPDWDLNEPIIVLQNTLKKQ
jgi:hypothetical protein